MPFCVVERAVLHFETARFADPNGAFCKHHVAVSQHADSQMVGSPQVLFFIPRRYFDFVLILSADIYCRDFDGYCLFTGMEAGYVVNRRAKQSEHAFNQNRNSVFESTHSHCCAYKFQPSPYA